MLGSLQSIAQLGWLGLALASTICWALWAVFAKASGLGWRELTFWSQVFPGLLAVGLLAGGRMGWQGTTTAFAILAGLCGFGGLAFFYAALHYGRSGVVVPLTSLYPALVVVLSVSVLREPVTVRQLAGLGAALAAGLLLARE